MADDNVVKLQLVEVGDAVHLAPDSILEEWKGKLEKVCIIGIDASGELVVAGTDSANFCLWLVEKAKKDILV